MFVVVFDSSLNKIIYCILHQSDFPTTVAEYFWHQKFIFFLQASYVKNLLEVSKYLPILRAGILELVIDNLIKIDVSNNALDS